MTDFPKSRRFSRRSLLGTAAAAAAAPAPRLRAQSGSTIDSEALECAANLSGVGFNGDKRAAIAGSLTRLKSDYEALRALPLSYDLEPAITFHPYVENATPSGPATPGARIRLSTSRQRANGSSDLAFMSIAEQAMLLRQRKVSSVELTALYLGRLKKYGPGLECVVSLAEEQAMAQARRADQELRVGKSRGPLHGIPWGVKDLFATRGLPTTWGAKPFDHQTFDEDATVVRRLHEAGAILVAKLSTGELAGNDLWHRGKTKNPWNLQTGSGGSSAGSCAATSAGLVSFSVGTDTGGSILQPADRCGVVGLRPTYGRVSRHGVMPLRWTIDKVGPIGRYVEDCAIVLNAIYGPDGRDRSVADIAFPWKPDATPSKNLRIGFVASEFESPPRPLDATAQAQWPEHRARLIDVLGTLRRAGWDPQPVGLPDLPAEAAWRIMSAESGAVFDSFVRSGAVDELRGTGPNERANQLRVSRYIPAVEYLQAQRVRALLGREFERMFASVDVIVSPVYSRLMSMASMTGHPSTTVRADLINGMPVGALLTGRLYGEAVLLRVALAYEQSTQWHLQHPAFP